MWSFQLDGKGEWLEYNAGDDGEYSVESEYAEGEYESDKDDGEGEGEDRMLHDHNFRHLSTPLQVYWPSDI